MAQRRGFSRARSSGTKRLTDWSLGPGGETNTTFTSSTNTIVGSGVTPVGGKFTIIRTRGDLSGSLASAAAGANGFACAFGIAVVTLTAFAIGATAVPNPLDEADWDGWLYHRFFGMLSSAPISNAASEDVDAVLPVVAAVRFEVDSKAMRKIDETEVVASIMATTEIGTATMNVMFNSRMLVKLA